MVGVPHQTLQHLHRHVHQEVQVVHQTVLVADQVDQVHPVVGMSSSCNSFLGLMTQDMGKIAQVDKNFKSIGF